MLILLIAQISCYLQSSRLVTQQNKITSLYKLNFVSKFYCLDQPSMNGIQTSTYATTTIEEIPLHGSPIVRSVDKSENKAVVSLTVTGEQSQAAFVKSCDMYNDVRQN